MSHRILLSACLLPAALLSACAGTRNPGVESVHQPVVGRANYLLDLASPGGRLAAGEQARLTGWLTGLRVGYGDRVSLDDQTGSGGGAARDAVAGVVAGFGMLLTDEAAPAPAPVAPDTVRVIVSRMRAQVGGCNDWSRDPSNDLEQHTSSTYGCATNSNLAAMVANPQDLIRGAGAAQTDPAVVFKSIDSFRKAAPSGGGGQTMKSESVGGR